MTARAYQGVQNCNANDIIMIMKLLLVTVNPIGVHTPLACSRDHGRVIRAGEYDEGRSILKNLMQLTYSLDW